ncbi:MAG: oxygen-dependent coproporphyrinogen oxidase [Bacteroidia bacterium]|nr:oxygen-dependent coproporphyrinogen oxidase [Bacteroidia bacterium]
MELTNLHHQIENFLFDLQVKIIHALESEDNQGKFNYDLWERKEGGGGKSAILENGLILEKAGVNVSAVWGIAPEFLFKEKEHSEITDGIKEKLNFYATGLSLVIHPKHPLIPIIHMNIRYFELSNGVWWFGGGIDLTPHYVDAEQARWFHRELKKHCDTYHPEFYPKFKKWADDYFFLPHRNETRGIGGIFFDRLNENSGLDKEKLVQFWKDLGMLFIPIYTTLIQWNKNKNFQDSHIDWQLVRRSRYVEFNLLYDKGTKFGLETGGRTESILMSLPPLAAWKYNYIPEKHSEEFKTLELLKKGINWIDF